MSKKPRSYEEELAAIMNALAEYVAEASSEEILEEARAHGEDPAESAQHVKNLLANTIKLYRQKRLHEAQQQYETHIAAIQTRTYLLPASPIERRQLLDFVLTQQSEVRSALTVQHREFTSFSDADVESCLKQLQELGFLDELSTSAGSKK